MHGIQLLIRTKVIKMNSWHNCSILAGLIVTASVNLSLYPFDRFSYSDLCFLFFVESSLGLRIE